MKLFLRSKSKAYRFEDCYPQGNGLIGIMDNCGPIKNSIVLNDEGMWSGNKASKTQKYCGKEGLNEIREALKNKDFAQAERLVKEKISGQECESYIPIGELTIDKGWGSFRKYERVLDIERAVLSSSYVLSDREYNEESFVSNPDNVYVKKITSSQKSIFRIRFLTTHPTTIDYKDKLLTVLGRAPSHIVYYGLPSQKPIQYDENEPGQLFSIAIKLETDADQIYYSNGTIRVANATFLTIYYSSLTETGLLAIPSSDLPESVVNKSNLDTGLIETQLTNYVVNNTNMAYKKRYLGCLKNHLEDYSRLFSRTSFQINQVDKSPENLNVALRKRNQDDSLIVTSYAFSRYLMISSSRENSALPANLQGIWSREKRPMWSSGYTMNINLQMNYWPVMSANLSECSLPFFKFVKNLMYSGMKNSKEIFEMNGFFLGHNSDSSFHSSPVGGETKYSSASYSLSMATSGWLVNQMFDIYSFSKDQELLEQSILPVAEQAILFYLDYLYENEKGELCSGPDISPENSYLFNGNKYSIDEAPAMTLAVIRELFENYLEYGKDNNLLKIVKETRGKIQGYRVCEDGRIAEWSSDLKEADINHRHLSHLYGLYPGKEILENEDLKRASLKTLEARGDGGTGWSLAWKICLYARLGLGDKANELLKKQFRPTYAKRGQRGGSYFSLLSAHPPFQIDGNFGTLAGINEILLQALSEKGINSIPSDWKSGKVTGLRTRENKHVDIEWRDGEIINTKIKNL